MEIGWIDFSNKERKDALNILHLLEEEGAIDELGIGSIRDAFANKFFPGTSTLMTRAKYFFIIPYAIYDAVNRKEPFDNSKMILDEIENKKERWCGEQLKKKYGLRNGIIGARILPNKWVTRKPSSIYWNGLKKI